MKLYGKWAACLVGAVGYGAALWLWPFSPVTFLLGVAVCSYITQLLHELGHLLACRLLGLQWKRLRFLGLVFEPGKGVAIDRDARFFSSGCTFAYSPQGPTRRYILALLGGAISTLLLAVLAGIPALYTAGSLQAFLWTLSAVAAVDGLANLLIPISPDRKMIRQIRHNQE